MRPGSFRLAGLVIVAALLTGACSSAGGSRTSEALQRHAVTAGEVMTRGLYPTSANDAAYQVVGRSDGTTITAVALRGTTVDGEVVLRIEVSDGAGTLSGETSAACFRYVFRHRLDDATPHRLRACPPGPPAAVTTPPPPAPITAATVAVVRQVLAGLSPARRQDPAAVRAALGARLGPRYVVVSGRDGATTSMQVRSGDQCVNGTVAPGGIAQVSGPAHGTDCRGG